MKKEMYYYLLSAALLFVGFFLAGTRPDFFMPTGTMAIVAALGVAALIIRSKISAEPEKNAGDGLILRWILSVFAAVFLSVVPTWLGDISGFTPLNDWSVVGLPAFVLGIGIYAYWALMGSLVAEAVATDSSGTDKPDPK